MDYLEYYKWEITLRDGSLIDQSKLGEKETFLFNEKNPKFSQIKTFSLVPRPEVTHLKTIKVSIPEGARLIYFRRTCANTGNAYPKFQINLIGWQMTKNNENIKFIMFVYPDGRIEAGSKDEPTYFPEYVNGLVEERQSEKAKLKSGLNLGI
jgi:hypothetical protein